MRTNTKIIILSSVAIIVFSFYFFNAKETNDVVPVKISSPVKSPMVVTVAGSVVLKSFQSSSTPEAATKIEDLSYKPTREPAAERKEYKKNSSSAVKSGRTQVLKSINLNGAPYIWLNSLSAKRSLESVGKSDSPDGFEITTTAPQNSLVTFNANALYVVTDKFGFEKKIITGVLIVKLRDISTADSLAKANQMDVSYLAPQINTALLQVRSGQNIFEKEKSLRTSPEVKSVSLEILGKGASIK